MRIGTVLVGAMIASSLPAGPASAHDHAPTDAVLETKRDHRQGIRIASCWIRGTESGGAALCTQEKTSFPEAIEAPAGAAEVVFKTRREPARVRLRAYRRLRADGEPQRPAKRLEVVPEPTPKGWLLAFELPIRHPTWFLEVKGVWPDANFPESEQFAVWTFALEIP
ncbi:MAG: hypothetical protein M3135_04300 [Actinomycetota bacterium]|nr:hypothetical protein [Actinomycetota bacterium]